MKGSKRQSGFTLIELMVGLLIGLIITAGVVNVFVSIKQAYWFTDAESDINERGWFVVDRINAQLRRSGYANCFGDLTQNVDNVLSDQANLRWDISVSIQGYNNVSSFNSHGITNVVDGTDLLFVKGLSDETITVVSSTFSKIKVSLADNAYSAGDLLIVTDCEDASLFQMSGTQASGASDVYLLHTAGGMTPGNSSSLLVKDFENGSTLGQLDSVAYYLGTGVNGRSALFEASVNASGGWDLEELIPNVANLQIEYGVDSDGDSMTDSYADASSVADWDAVMSVRYVLLLESMENNILQDQESYSFSATSFTFTKDGTPGGSADKRLRRVSNGFVSLRNRVL